jgi:hypothetical protein
MSMATVVIWCVGFGSYLIFAGTVSFDELITGAAVATLATAWAYLISGCARRRFGASREQIVPALRAIAGLAPATLRTAAILTGAALRGGSPGRALRSPLRFGVWDDPAARSRRALAVLCASLAPDRFVVHLDQGRSEAVMHAIGRAEREVNPEWLQ